MKGKIENLTLIGEVSSNLKEVGNEAIYYLIGRRVYATYHGIKLQEHYKPFETKGEAIESAKKYANWAKLFPDSTKPFGLVFYIRGYGWVSVSSNLIDNCIRIRTERLCSLIL